ncbi:MAG TPA: gamma-glutamyltransferase [Acidimicrobiales bacterium]|nr:gamma-glutamyltransferase [Acidimicrobiales bacterium]
MPSVPFVARRAAGGMVAAADQLACSAGVAMLERGGSAADATVAAAVAMAVVGPHLCGLGGDVLAMVKAPGEPPAALLSVGRAGTGADPERLRVGGHSDMPLRGDVASVPVPGAVDGWLALHERYGNLPWTTVLRPAVTLAEEGFPASEILAFATHLVAGLPGTSDLCPDGPLEPNQLVRLPGVAATLRAIAAQGREGFYGGEFGHALLELGDGEYRADDLRLPLAEWAPPLSVRALGHDLWTVPPPSQGYVTLAAAWIAEQLALPDDPGDPRWPHLVAEIGRVAAFDRPSVLYDGADGVALLAPERLGPRAEAVNPDHRVSSFGGFRSAVSASPPGATAARGLSSDGDTTHLCAVDGDGLGVSLTQSNALDFGAHLVAGATGVFLHNRGVGFSLEPGHPGEYGPGRRPSHTLSPALVTRPDGSLAQVIGTMGGDIQPQILLQLLLRTLVCGQGPAEAISAARVVPESPGAPPFRLWHAATQSLLIELHAPASWQRGLEERGHGVRVVGAFNPVDVGCSQIISLHRVDGRSLLLGASDPRSPEGDALGR